MSHDKHPSFTMGTTDLTPKAVTNHQTVTSNAVAEQIVPRHILSIQIGKYLMGKISTTSDFHDELVCQIKINLALY